MESDSLNTCTPVEPKPYADRRTESPKKMDEAEAVRDEDLSDTEVDAVAGGQEGSASDGPGKWHVGPSGSYWHGHSREWYECSKCGGCIIPGKEREHICKPPERR